ncbi:hypothetical protein BC629DRAFT_1059599 [Irpex lacteus]|nr:hypothetical protein BC629DRAFT_1059599 [Irpex lacteus]
MVTMSWRALRALISHLQRYVLIPWSLAPRSTTRRKTLSAPPKVPHNHGLSSRTHATHRLPPAQERFNIETHCHYPPPPTTDHVYALPPDGSDSSISLPLSHVVAVCLFVFLLVAYIKNALVSRGRRDDMKMMMKAHRECRAEMRKDYEKQLAEAKRVDQEQRVVIRELTDQVRVLSEANKSPVAPLSEAPLPEIRVSPVPASGISTGDHVVRFKRVIGHAGSRFSGSDGPSSLLSASTSGTTAVVKLGMNKESVPRPALEYEEENSQPEAGHVEAMTAHFEGSRPK